MKYDRELAFFRRLLAQLNIPSHIFLPDELPEVDGGLRRLLGAFELEPQLFKRYSANTVYYVTDNFACSYCSLMLPNEGKTEILLVGPYLLSEISEADVVTMLERFSLSPSLTSVLEHYYRGLAVMANGDVIDALMNALGNALWGDADAFAVRRLEPRELPVFQIQGASEADGMAEAYEIRMLEERYFNEEKLMQAVSMGMTKTAVRMLSGGRKSAIERRTADPIRNMKNYAIIINTLLRKAAQRGGVHPYHINKLSSAIARKIEAAHSTEQLYSLHSEMTESYCELVHNRTMKPYSPLVRQVMLRTDTDLTADLSLNAHANALNANPSYLSTLFKRETGMTLTEYVNSRRCEYAAFLLGATDMQVQAIAQYCGLLDANYFTKTFKRIYGKTPNEYRRDLPIFEGYLRNPTRHEVYNL
ncbi:MAG: helix-turn-helix domain-containing protein [Clostridia bacterium]|nr:helix-turn-helix domain-containing protein [Clostridia bacterium]